MKNYRINLFFITLISTLYGCASTTGIDPSALKKTKKQNYVLINDDLKWEEKFSLAQLTHFMTLRSGKYNANLDDRNGTYYEGENACLDWKVAPTSGKSEPRGNTLKCGVYIPNDEKNRALVYFYADQKTSQEIMTTNKPGVIIEALSNAEMNNLKHLMYQPEAQKLRSYIEVID